MSLRSTPSERILMELKMRGGMTAAAVGQRLGTSGEAVRQQLLKLLEEGLVASSSTPSGVGRPTQTWTLSPSAQSRFPDTHAALTVEILSILRSEFGEAVVDAVVARREAATLSIYAKALAGCASLGEQVAELARLRTEEGYMAACEEQSDGSYLLIENHCPICAAAAACQGFCRAELEVFQSLLGPQASVERGEHIIRGGRRCTYIVRGDQR